MITDLKKTILHFVHLQKYLDYIFTVLAISQFTFHYFLGSLNVTPVTKEAMM